MAAKGQVIRQQDPIQSIADALQYIRYSHPADAIRNLAVAHEREQSPAAKDAIARILISSRMIIVQDMPVTLAVNSAGESGRKTGPREWQARIGRIPMAVES